MLLGVRVSFSANIREHIRSNVVGYVALFCFVIGGTAGALPGKNKVNSGDIKNGNVRNGDVGADAIDSTKILDNSIVGADVNEATLDLPAPPTIPSSLPPSGPAGGDLSGTYPDAAVKETALDLGGDLGGTVAGAQIGADKVGDAEIQDGSETIFIPAASLSGALTISGAMADAGELNGWPVVGFNGTVDESLEVVLRAPSYARLDNGDFDSVNIRPIGTPVGGTGSVAFISTVKIVSNGDVLAAAAAQSTTTSTLSNPTAGVVSGFGSLSTAAPDAGDIIKFEMTRDASLDGNNLDLAILGVEVSYPIRR